MISGYQKTMKTCASIYLSLLIFDVAAIYANDITTENRKRKTTTQHSFLGNVDFQEDRNAPDKSLKILLLDMQVTDIGKS